VTAEVYFAKAEWLAARMRSIGASEAAAVLNCSEWETAEDILAAKVNGTTKPDNNHMRAGRIFEPAILQYWAEGYGARLEPAAMGYTLYRHPRMEFVSASPDRFAFVGSERIVAQAKRTHPKHLAKALKNGPRIEHTVQVQHELFVLWETDARCERGVLVVDYGGDDVLSFPIEPDPELWASMERVYREFWAKVEEMRALCA
jgi:putative phage-type endonuclease